MQTSSNDSLTPKYSYGREPAGWSGLNRKQRKAVEAFIRKLKEHEKEKNSETIEFRFKKDGTIHGMRYQGYEPF